MDCDYILWCFRLSLWLGGRNEDVITYFINKRERFFLTKVVECDIICILIVSKRRTGNE